MTFERIFLATSVDKNKKQSLERLKNQLEQAKLNLKLATQNEDKCDIKSWSKQIRFIEAILKKIQDDAVKKF